MPERVEATFTEKVLKGFEDAPVLGQEVAQKKTQIEVGGQTLETMM